MSSEGVISWTNDKSLENPQPVNIKGPQGPAGEDGAPGAKGDPGDSGVYYGSSQPADGSKVWIDPSGEADEVLPEIGGNGNWWVNGVDTGTQAQGPQGAKGDKGDKGDTGATGADGAAGPNEVSTATDSSITGLLKGASGKVAQAVAGTDYEAAGTAASAVATHNTAGDAHSTLFAGKANTSHTQAASTITAGTLAGEVDVYKRQPMALLR